MNLKSWMGSLRGWRARALDMGIGALSALGYAPFHIGLITLLGLAWLMVRLDGDRVAGRSGFKTAFIFALGYFLANTYWIGSAFIERGPEFIPAMPPMILALAAILALLWAIAGWVYTRVWRTSKMPHFWGLAALLFLAEWVRGHIWGGFPWNLPGYIFKAGGWGSQGASVAGIYGLSLWVLALTSCLAHILSHMMKDGDGESAGHWRLYMGHLVMIVILCGGLFGFGFWRLSQAQMEFVDDVKLRIVQVPFSQADKFDPDLSVQIVNDFISESLAPGHEEITHLIWPEGAIVGLVFENMALLGAMESTLRHGWETPPYWILNSLRAEPRAPGHGVYNGRAYFNSSAIIGLNEAGELTLMAYNDKYRLVPFGEYMPGGKWIEDLGGEILSTALGSITPAPSKSLADFPGAPKLSPQLCYEIIFPGLTPSPMNDMRANWILNQSNDAWFGPSVGPAQHANIAAYRAIEEGVPVVRAASNGFSGVIDPYGRFVTRIDPQDKGALDSFLPQALPRPTYRGYFNLGLALLTLMALIIERGLRLRQT